MPVNRAIDQVTGDTAADEAQGDLTAAGMDIEVVASEEEDHEGHEGEEGEPHIDALELVEEAPGGAWVGPVDEAEEAVYDDTLLGGIEPPEDEPFGGLICDEDGEGDPTHFPEEVQFMVGGRSGLLLGIDGGWGNAWDFVRAAVLRTHLKDGPLADWLTAAE